MRYTVSALQIRLFRERFYRLALEQVIKRFYWDWEVNIKTSSLLLHLLKHQNRHSG